MSDPIIVWPYEEAPSELQISTNGGDEDWLAEVPPHLKREWIGWMDSFSFSCGDVEVLPHPTKPGWEIRIGSHA